MSGIINSKLTYDERATMLELLGYPNPQGLHPNEERWRNFSRVELTLRDERIHQLEKLNSRLAEQVDRMRPVVDTAVRYGYGQLHSELGQAVAIYEQQMAALGKG